MTYTLVDERDLGEELDRAERMLSLRLTERQLYDFEMIVNGGFSPLQCFLGEKDYWTVLKDMRLSDGSLWPIPVYLDVSKVFALNALKNKEIALLSKDNNVIAIMSVQEIFERATWEEESRNVLGTVCDKHPSVDYLKNRSGDFSLNGSMKVLSAPLKSKFGNLYKTPSELIAIFKKKSLSKVMGFQTRNPMHRGHKELTDKVAASVDAHILLHPIVGIGKPGDVPVSIRIETYKRLLKYYTPGSVTLSLLPLAMRMAGPREALWHALIRKNFGCSHFVVGRDHAGPGEDRFGVPFYGLYDAQDLAYKYEGEIGIKILKSESIVYVPEVDAYMPESEASCYNFISLSGTKLRSYIKNGERIPDWLCYPDVAEIIKLAYETI